MCCVWTGQAEKGWPAGERGEREGSHVPDVTVQRCSLTQLNHTTFILLSRAINRQTPQVLDRLCEGLVSHSDLSGGLVVGDLHYKTHPVRGVVPEVDQHEPKRLESPWAGLGRGWGLGSFNTS